MVTCIVLEKGMWELHSVLCYFQFLIPKDVDSVEFRHIIKARLFCSISSLLLFGFPDSITVVYNLLFLDYYQNCSNCCSFVDSSSSFQFTLSINYFSWCFCNFSVELFSVNVKHVVVFSLLGFFTSF